MKLIGMTKWMLFLPLACASSTASALNYELTLPDGDAGHIQVLPGETGSYTFDIRNLDDEAAIAIGWARIEDYQAPQGYTFGPSLQAGCLLPGRTSTDIFAFRWNFRVELEAGETKRCTYPVTRNAASLATVRFFPCVGQNVTGSVACSSPFPLLIIGTLTDVAFSLSPISELAPGATETMVKVTVRNLSDVDIGSFKLATSCVTTPWNELPYSLEADFPDACPLVEPNPGCRYDTGFGVPLPLFNWLVGVSPTPAQGESSCLVRMRFRQPLITQVVDTLELRRPQQDRFPPIPLPQPAYAQGRDVNASNDGPRPFGAVPFVATPVPSVGRIALVGSVLMFIALAGLRYRRRKLDK